MIVDVNHDSANTGQTNCYDLMAVDCVYSLVYGQHAIWRSSNARTWLNSTYYLGFTSNFKSHIIKIKYQSAGSWYADDYVILPSGWEITGGRNRSRWSMPSNEGTMYEIQPSRQKRYTDLTSGDVVEYALRSRYPGATDDVLLGSFNGSLSGYTPTLAWAVSPLIRVH